MSVGDIQLRDRILAAADPVDVVMALFDQVQQRIGESGLGSLTAVELVVFCMYDLDSEVRNGGFGQFVFNSSGDRIPETLASLRMIGATQTASMLERVMARLGPQGASRDREVRIAVLQQLGNEGLLDLQREDAAFYEEPEPLWSLTAAYCRANRDQLRVRVT